MTEPDEGLSVYGTLDPVAVDAPRAVPNPLAGMPALARPSHPTSLGAFFRIVPAAPADVDAWWSSASAGGRVVLEHRLRLGPPRDAGGGARSIVGALRRPASRRWVPVELLLCPHLGTVSILTVHPGRRVRASRRWFRSGHVALARLAEDVDGFVSRRAGRAPLRS